MAKFIIEISDQQIRDLHDKEKVKEQAEGKENAMRVLFNMFAGVVISKKLDKGITEFYINREMMSDNKEKMEFFDKNVGDICMLANFAMPSEKKVE